MRVTPDTPFRTRPDMAILFFLPSFWYPRKDIYLSEYFLSCDYVDPKQPDENDALGIDHRSVPSQAKCPTDAFLRTPGIVLSIC